MRFIADFHIHSHFSLATSRELAPEFLDYWARIKGIRVVGTGDFTHPGWIKEMKEKFVPAEPGLFKLKKEFLLKNGRGDMQELTSRPEIDPRFILTSEISTIYKKNDKVRKVHSIIFAPDFETAEKINSSLNGLGANLKSDGRPIIGLDCRNLLEIALTASPDIFFVPAHIWTPWFSVLGSKSGFDSIDECFGDLSRHIYAVETGLSTDAPLNWMCSFLDRFTLLSNSDAHSPDKLGRNANIFNTDLSYAAILQALKTGDSKKFHGTIDLFPQEGKYHFDGHRKCGIGWDPVETFKHKGICPKCGKPVTVGVINRIVELSDRTKIQDRPNRLPFYSIIPLREILSEILQVGPASKKVDEQYFSFIKKFGPELNVLLDIPVEEIRSKNNPLLAEAIDRMRKRQVYIQEGYDGEYGVIKVFNEKELHSIGNSDSLFTNIKFASPGPQRELINFSLDDYQKLKQQYIGNPRVQPKLSKVIKSAAASVQLPNGLNVLQAEAAEHHLGHALVLAGPGTGKTKTLTAKIQYLLKDQKLDPGKILAITFTNKAAAEIRERVARELGEDVASAVTIKTFHGFGSSILNENAVSSKAFRVILSQDDRLAILRSIINNNRKTKSISKKLEQTKQALLTAPDIEDPELRAIFVDYQNYLKMNALVDFDDLIYLPYHMLKSDAKLRSLYQKCYQWILIDEYQDINFSQYQMIRLLCGKNTNVFAVGDPNQAIYGFRGSDVKFIQNYMRDFTGAKIFQLKQSYRCSNKILKASDNIINPGGVDTLLEGLHDGVNIQIHSSRTEHSEAEFVAQTIEQMIGGLGFYSMDTRTAVNEESAHITSLADFAILVRSKHQLPALMDALNNRGIPFQISNEDPLSETEPYRSILDILCFIQKPDNQFIRLRLMDNVSLKPLDLEHGFVEMRALSLHEKVTFICQNYLAVPIPKDEIDKAVAMARYCQNDASKFIELVNLNFKIDLLDVKLEKVSLLTLHAAKGLEFRCVFLAGCEDGLLPYTIFEKNNEDIEEERRLFYVGMTRAKNYIYLCSAQKRFLFGQEYRLKRSRFIDLIERGLLDLSKDKARKKTDKLGQPELF
ncbi:MAG: UvrD-helicase domain-containing protein [Candidatus Omnitrophica bacterium]|nr:UvrD-helicase domain-containing protein [Candidatus Omnitrophota bacterium]